MIVSRVRIEVGAFATGLAPRNGFNRVFGFPDFYGRNMNAWIDCLTCSHREEDGMTSVHVKPGHVLALEIADAAYLKKEHPEQYDAVIECAAFVNWRRVETGNAPVLALSFQM